MPDDARSPSADEGLARTVTSVIRAGRDRIGSLLAAIGGIMMAFGLVHVVLFWVGAVIILAGVVLGWHRVSAYRKLDQQLAQSEARALARTQTLHNILDSALRMLMDDLAAIDFSQARMSVYSHIGNEFFMLARVSHSLALEKPGRRHYPDSEGIIGETWDKGYASVTSLPTDRAEWNSYCADAYRMDAATVCSLSMQSLSFAGKRLENPSASDNPVGVLILESLGLRGVNGGTIDKLMHLASFPLEQLILAEVTKCLDEDDLERLRCGYADEN